MGDLYSNPDLLIPDVADRTNLQPLYNNLNKAIRSIDNQTLIFFEPVTWDYWPGLFLFFLFLLFFYFYFILFIILFFFVKLFYLYFIFILLFILFL